MPDQTALESRLSELEREFAELKHKLETAWPTTDWFARVAGSLQGDQEFDEVLRLGQELRRSDHPDQIPGPQDL